MSPPVDLDAMRVFVRIVEHGSLSAAGRALKEPKATLSRKLADLERTIGATLLRRTTRAHSLTDAGRALYDKVAPLLAEAERVANELRSASVEPSGLVRVSAALGFGRVLLPIVARFLAEFPKVRIELALSDEPVRVVDACFDLAIRMGAVEESDLVLRRLARIERAIVASPAYLKAHGTPRSMADLEHHSVLVRDASHASWSLEGDQGSFDVRVRWRVAASGMTNLLEAARFGMGVAFLPAYMAEHPLASRELVTLDLGVRPSPSHATALFSPTPSAATRAPRSHRRGARASGKRHTWQLVQGSNYEARVAASEAGFIAVMSSPRLDRRTRWCTGSTGTTRRRSRLHQSCSSQVGFGSKGNSCK